MPTPEPPDLKSLADLDPVIHAPARLAIMTALYIVECSDFTFLLRHTGLTRGNLSSHIAKLEEAHYLEVEKTFVDRVPRTVLRLTEEGRTALANYRKQMTQALNRI